MTGLPDSFASPLHLPFNRSCLDQQFELLAPLADPGGPGFSVFLHGSQMGVVLQAGQPVLPFGKGPDQALYLGSWQGHPCRLVALSQSEDLSPDLRLVSLVEENPRLPIDLLSLGGMARMILHWHERSRFCGFCSQPTAWQEGDWGKVCPRCKTPAYPAIHPCAIVLVTRPGEVLLTRKPNWAENRYSLVAGFQDFGESLEETALREIAEETGILAHRARYVGSQSWPFPSQVMIGFTAEYAGGEIRVDTSELADARWFAVDALPKLPPKRSIARYILDTTLGLS